LRHTFATQAISNGVEPETLAVLMGHADPVYLLNTYTHSTKDLELASSKYMTILLDNILEY
jgi:site-specific recombinase XerD